jgi:HEAT repeat protein
MKMHKHRGKIAGLVLLLLMLAVPLAAASAVSDNALIANDRTQSPDHRMKAILNLGASGDESAAPVLLRILKNTTEEQRVRTSAVVALKDLGTPRPTIIKALETAYGEPAAGKNFRYTILLSLGKLKAVESLTLLAGALSSSDSMIRMKAYQALGALESNDALQIMARYLKTEDDYMVRAAAVRAAGQSQSASAEAILVNALRSDQAPLVRYNAVLVLGQFVSLSAEAKAALEAAKNDESSVVRNAAKGVLP